MTLHETDARGGAGVPREAGADLRAAWDGLMAALSSAREVIDDPKLYPPPASERNLAEGYRYLLGYLHGAIDRCLADPEFPHFRRAIQPVDKATIDNADAIYLCAEIDGNHTYRVRGKAQDHRHWRGEPRVASGRKAPQYVIFEAPSGYAGDSGSLAELRPGSRINTGTLDSSQMLLEADGSFEILLAPERPEGYAGNFIATRASKECTQPDGTAAKADYVARYLVVRELFYDWESEDLLDLSIVRVDRQGEHPRSLSPERAAAQMERVGEVVNSQMRFWNEFYAVVLEVYGDMNGDGKCFMPRNGLNEPNALGIATGGGQSTNVYCGGVFELEEDEALVIEARIPVAPAYIGFHLSNLWGESTDYANHISSLNGYQAEWDSDGVLRWVIAHRDPGVSNWLDTTGLPEGFMALRFTYPEKPEELPELALKKLSFDEIRAQLPADVCEVSPDERREQIRIRQEHVQRRYRQY